MTYIQQICMFSLSVFCLLMCIYLLDTHQHEHNQSKYNWSNRAGICLYSLFTPLWVLGMIICSQNIMLYALYVIYLMGILISLTSILSILTLI